MKSSKHDKTESRMLLADHDVAKVFVYLALGILDAVSSNSVPPSVGTWTLARPISSQPISRLLPQELMECIEQFDELGTLDGGVGIRTVEELRLRLRSLASAFDDPSFYMRWGSRVHE
jgi:hypothetical protein